MENEEEIRKSSEFKLPVLYLRALSHCAHSILFFTNSELSDGTRGLAFPPVLSFPSDLYTITALSPQAAPSVEVTLSTYLQIRAAYMRMYMCTCTYVCLHVCVCVCARARARGSPGAPDSIPLPGSKLLRSATPSVMFNATPTYLRLRSESVGRARTPNSAARRAAVTVIATAVTAGVKRASA